MRNKFRSSPLSRARYSFVRHLPKEIAQAVDATSAEFRRELGLRSIDVYSWQNGLVLLGHLSEYARGTHPVERIREFGELWREALVETARRSKEAGIEDSVLRDAARSAGWDGAWAISANRPAWHRLFGEGAERLIPS